MSPETPELGSEASSPSRTPRLSLNTSRGSEVAATPPPPTRVWVIRVGRNKQREREKGNSYCKQRIETMRVHLIILSVGLAQGGASATLGLPFFRREGCRHFGCIALGCVKYLGEASL